MKLLFIHQKLGNLGGAEANILLTAQELTLRGHLLELAYLERTARNEANWEKAFQAAHCLNADAPAFALENLLHLTKPDLVYLNTISDLSMLGVMAEMEVPVVRRVHDH